MNGSAKRTASQFSISRFDRIMLAYGALCGFALVTFAIGNPWLGLVLGIPPGIIGVGVPILVHKHVGSSANQLAFLPAAKQRQILIIASVSIAGWLAYRVIVDDWFGFACTLMAAGMLVLVFAHSLGFWHEPIIEKKAV